MRGKARVRTRNLKVLRFEIATFSDDTDWRDITTTSKASKKFRKEGGVVSKNRVAENGDECQRVNVSERSL